jgi:lysophospholipase L1-like esterase
MGKGVIAYWSTQPAPPSPIPTNPNQPPPGAITMNIFPIPLVTIQQLISGVTANIVVYSNIVTNPGKWIKPLAAININNNQSNRQTGLTGANVTTADPIDANTKEKILFVGDSLSAIINEKGQNITWTYPTSVRKSLPNATVDVLAIPAKQTSWMLQNLPSQLATTKYDRVYIWGGTNDMFSGVSFKAALGNIQKMVDLAISNGAKAYVIIGYDVKNMDYNRMSLTRYLKDKTEYIPLIERYNEYQQQIPSAIQNAKFIGIFDLGILTTDGIHPSAVQARQIANIIINAL